MMLLADMGTHATGAAPGLGEAAGEAAGARLRRCIATGARAPRAHLVRLVVSPSGALTPDLAARLPGRGAWLAPSRAAIERAVKGRLFAKALHAAAPPSVPEDLAGLIERLLVRRMVDALGLARRAGQAVAGSAKVEQALGAGHVGLLLLARDAGEDLRRRRRTLPDGVACIALLDGAEIGQAFARPRAAQAAVAPGELMQRLVDDAHRLAGLRPAETMSGLRPAGESNTPRPFGATDRQHSE